MAWQLRLSTNALDVSGVTNQSSKLEIAVAQTGQLKNGNAQYVGAGGNQSGGLSAVTLTVTANLMEQHVKTATDKQIADAKQVDHSLAFLVIVIAATAVTVGLQVLIQKFS